MFSEFHIRLVTLKGIVRVFFDTVIPDMLNAKG